MTDFLHKASPIAEPYRGRDCRPADSFVVISLRFRDATLDDAPVIAALQNAAAGALTARFGAGHWSSLVTERGAAQAQRHARVRVGKSGKRILTVVRLADALRLDAYDSPAGAGDFYLKCGFKERGRVVYRGDPLVYYELLLE